MDEPNDDARAVIASYRRARVLDADARARVHARLLMSTRGEQPFEPMASRRRQLVTIAAIAMATAAGVVLAAQLLWGNGVRVAEAPRNDAASFDVDAREHVERVVVPATPPATVRSQPDEDGSSQLAKPPLQRSTTRSIAPSAATSVPVTDADALAAELARMHAARAALTRGDAYAALRELATDERAGDSGQLVEERRALRVEALCLAGKRPQARAEAQQFARDYPRSTQRERVAEACAGADSTIPPSESARTDG
jgi:hypothetical protein